ncbi:hypothetical protein JW905_07125, partial [bacterium]|nr:hypothetical protein [candidate division CSSED10-310 bacterium]
DSGRREIHVSDIDGIAGTPLTLEYADERHPLAPGGSIVLRRVVTNEADTSLGAAATAPRRNEA